MPADLRSQSHQRRVRTAPLDQLGKVNPETQELARRSNAPRPARSSCIQFGWSVLFSDAIMSTFVHQQRPGPYGVE